MASSRCPLGATTSALRLEADYSRLFTSLIVLLIEQYSAAQRGLHCLAGHLRILGYAFSHCCLCVKPGITSSSPPNCVGGDISCNTAVPWAINNCSGVDFGCPYRLLISQILKQQSKATFVDRDCRQHRILCFEEAKKSF